MEPNGVPPSKPKSRLLAMKNRLRQKQKKDVLSKSNSAGGIALQNGEVGSKTMTRSRTYEGKLLDTSPGAKDVKKSKLMKSRSTDAELKFSKSPESGKLVKSQTANGKLNLERSNGTLKFTNPSRGSRLPPPPTTPQKGKTLERSSSASDAEKKPIINNGAGADYVENIRILKKYPANHKGALSPGAQRPRNLALGKSPPTKTEIRTGSHLQEEVGDEGGFVLQHTTKQNFAAHEIALGYTRTKSFSTKEEELDKPINKRHSRSLENLLSCGRRSLAAEQSTIQEPPPDQHRSGPKNIQHLLKKKVVPPNLQEHHKIESEPNLYGARQRSSECKCGGGEEMYEAPAPPRKLGNIHEGLQYNQCATSSSRSGSYSGSSCSGESHWSTTDSGVSQTCKSGKAAGLKCSDPGDTQHQRRVANGYHKPNGGVAMTTDGPRRHTVSGVDTVQRRNGGHDPPPPEVQKEVIYDHLACRYPEHAHIIQQQRNGQENASYGQLPRRPQYEEPSHQGAPLEPDDELDGDTSPTGGFRRGTRARTSLPLIRSPNRSMERPIGQVFLTFRNETKRALLPNELTSIDTIRALFVRSFPDALSMQLFESAAKRIYILEAATSVFYELDDLRDVRDKSVLKVIERTGALPPAPPSPLRSPALRRTEMLGSSGAFPGYDSDSSTRSAPVNGPRSPAHGRPPASPRLFHYEVPSKVGSLPVQPNYMSMEQIRRQAASRGAPWSPTRGRGSGESAPSRSNQSSPQRTPLLPPGVPPNPQRHSVAYLPDQGGVYGHIPMQQSRSYHDYPDADGASSQSGSITPTHDNKETKVRMEKMEVQLANLQAWVEHAAQCKAKSVPTSEGGSVRSVASAVSGSSSSVKSKSNNSTPTFESPGQPGMSDLSSATPQPFISVDLQNSVSSLHKKAVELKAELARLREAQLSNQQTMRHMIEETFAKIKETMATVAPSNPAPASGASKRDTVNHLVNEYKNESQRVNKDLGDLVASVEELRIDVLNKKCRVNLSEVESMALALSHISKSLADLKSKFPSLSDNMKTVMAAEIEEVVSEEKFIKEEPDNLDNSLKKCKKLTSTLFTLKRLAAVQDQRPPQIPQFKTDKAADRNELMGNIMAMVPDHEARLQSLQATEQSRERKMKIVAGSESLKFSKSIEIAQKQLKETHNITANELRQEKLLSEIYSTVKKVYEEPAQKAVEKLYEEPTQLKNDVPKKPPRTMEYGSSDESVNVSAISAVVSAGNSRMATFTSNESSSPKPVVAEINPMTSTPKNHVTFSGTVVEITDSKAGGGKKVPPPPPPRKSSAKLSSPVSKIQQMPLPPTPESPPTYENLDTLRQKKQRPKSSEVVREKSSVGNRPRSDGPTIQDLYAKVQQQNKNGGDTTEDSGGSSSSLDSQKGGKRPESSAIPQRKVSCEESAYCTVKEVAYKNNGQNVAQLQKSLFNGGQKSVARQPDVTKQRTMSKNHEETEIY